MPNTNWSKEVLGLDAFVIEIAGSAFGVQPLFHSTQAYCSAYLTDKAPEFSWM